MVKLLFACIIIFLTGCTAQQQLKIGETDYINPNKPCTRIEDNLYFVKDTVDIKEYVYSDVRLKVPFFYDIQLRLSKYKDGNILFSAPYFSFDRSLFLRSVIFSNGTEKVEIKINNMSRIDGVPNVYLTKEQINTLKKLLETYKNNIVARVSTEKESLDFYLQDYDIQSWLRIINYK